MTRPYTEEKRRKPTTRAIAPAAAGLSRTLTRRSSRSVLAEASAGSFGAITAAVRYTIGGAQGLLRGKENY